MTTINETDRTLLIGVLEAAVTSAEHYREWCLAASCEELPERDAEVHRIRERIGGLRALLRKVRMTSVAVA
jgi:hypothetical protein